MLYFRKTCMKNTKMTVSSTKDTKFNCYLMASHNLTIGCHEKQEKFSYGLHLDC